MELYPHIVSVLAGYLLGSIPFGLLLAKAAGLGDIRQIGSGNIGTTNVLRTGRKDIALLTLLLDALKAGAAGLIAAHFFGQPFGYIAAAAALFGHCYPVWLKFKGGKGVATFFGGLLALAWPAGIAAALTWLATALITKYSSLSALLAAGIAPIVAYVFVGLTAFLMVAFMSCVIYWRHRDNIRRLLRGEESKIGAKS
ncbi:glycerol-3-phosphate 1-O-acyltransferase PlsY [Litorimonas sp. RW-G-Af-16]|uniref:glycerol-3-phosphate 1-O-acyltransferase PlsY n=1 Tax=Litorimonas sp. RW-G-Af-16 TaxID=3241168 RepID=UPI00390C5E9D